MPIYKFFIAILLIAVSGNIKAQYRNDKWIVGLNPLLFDFQTDTLKNSIYTVNNTYYDDAHSNINDSLSVLFSCNGFNIFDVDGQLMENGKNILPEKLINSSQGGNYSRYNQQSIILPKKENSYYVFAWGISDKNFDLAQINGGWYINDILTYSIVDLEENNGKGKVISKMNYLLENDSLSLCQMSAVRHANGRDWWLIKPHMYRHRFYSFLVTPDSIIQQPNQEFDSPIFANGINGQSNFSHDGCLYVLTSEANNHFTQVNYFDRCTGKMTKYKTIPWVFDIITNQWMVVNTACISPNNKYVYLINNISIVQYDLETDERIEILDGLYNPCNNVTSYNGPDGKIYIGNFHGQCSAISYIEFPNRKGKDAHYCPLCYQTKNNNTKSPPNNPNYELGALKGSPCDTINPPSIPVAEITIYPNPVSEKLTLEFPLGIHNAEVAIFNMLGQRVHLSSHSEILNNKIELPVGHLAKALYGIKIITDGEQFVGKFVRE